MSKGDRPRTVCKKCKQAVEVATHGDESRGYHPRCELLFWGCPSCRRLLPVETQGDGDVGIEHRGCGLTVWVSSCPSGHDPIPFVGRPTARDFQAPDKGYCPACSAEWPWHPFGESFLKQYRLKDLARADGARLRFRARDRNAKRDVIVETVPPRRDPGDTKKRVASPRIEAFVRIAHAHTVRVFEVGRSRGVPYAILDPALSPTLAERMTAGPLPAAEAVPVFAKLLSGLEAVHAKNVIHGAIHPANIVLGEGAPRLGPPPLVEPYGAPDCVAPEVTRGSRETAASDIYAAGASLWFALTGAPPGKGPSADGLAPGLRRVLDRALADRPADRFPTPRAFLDALQAGDAPAVAVTAAATATATASPDAAGRTGPRTHSPSRGGPGLVLGLVALVVAIAAVAALLLR